MNMNDEDRNTTVMMLRLLNGDEIVGKVGVMGNMIKVIKPAAVMLNPGPGGKAQMALLDFIPMARTKEIILDPRNVMFTYENGLIVSFLLYCFYVFNLLMTINSLAEKNLNKVNWYYLSQNIHIF